MLSMLPGALRDDIDRRFGGAPAAAHGARRS